MARLNARLNGHSTRPSGLRRSGMRRSGVALLIVIAMLALFATVGLAFVFYAEAESTSARFFRMAQQLPNEATDISAGQLFDFALGQLIYEPDLTKNPNSSLTGFSLARSMYGPTCGTTAFNGLGRPRNDATALNALTPLESVNVPYTFPDINNPFLGKIDSTGTIVIRSFDRNGSTLRPAALGAAPAGGDGDVRNVESSKGVTGGNLNDSFWMDLGHPVMTTKNGTRYKPLFAFFVLDLDGRVNLSAAGNLNADYVNAGSYTSRLGLGAFEINPARVLAPDSKTDVNLYKAQLADVPKIFTGDPSSRFPSGAPTGSVNFPTTRLYNRVDYSGVSGSVPAASAAGYSHVPSYGWSDWTAGQPHPLGFDYINSKNEVFSPSNVQSLLCFRDKGAANFTGDLMRLLPKSLDSTSTAGQTIMSLVTPHSMSLDTAHLAPFVVGDGTAKYAMGPTDAYPKFSTTTQTAGGGGGGETTSSMHSRTAAELRRLNLNRGFGSMQDRQTMAKEIFDRLLAVTGAQPPGPYAPFQPATTSDTQFRAARWLAQYAVNIVDFIDDDDIMTCFNWNVRTNGSPSAPEDFVFGAERPRLVINEALATFDNDKDEVAMNGGNKAFKYRVNTYAELYNPNNASAPNNGVATLTAGGRNHFRILLAKDTSGITDSPTGLPANLLYDLNSPQATTDWTTGATTVDPGDLQSTLNPPAWSPTSFCFIGAVDSTEKLPSTFLTSPSRQPKFSNACRLMSSMSSKLIDVPAGATTVTTYKPVLVLQRLADTTRDEQSDPTQPGYNPFVTVDYFDNINAYNSMKYTNTTSNSPAAFSTYSASGRFQPLEGGAIPKVQAPFPAKTGTEPQNTFGIPNEPKRFAYKFSPYYHLDRPLVSAAEVMNAPAQPPWQITRVFPNPNTAYTAYSDPSSLLYRFLETVTVGDRGYNAQLAGSNPSGIAGAGKSAVLVPGRINLNAVQDKSVLMALFDPQVNSWFKESDIDTFWSELQAARPIAGFGDYGYDGTTITTKRTLLENMFKKISNRIRTEATSTTEYEQTETLRKVMNNMTFTSNTFAVWMTVGFFNVNGAEQPTTEIGKADGSSMRHRAFAVVDRSYLVIPDQQLTTLSAGVSQTPLPATATLAAVSGSMQEANGLAKVECPNWTIKPGVALTIDKDQPTEETVMVMSVTGNTISTGCFRQSHAAGATVHLGGVRGPQVPLGNGYVLGNPGPQPNFNLREYTYVVPFYSIID